MTLQLKYSRFIFIVVLLMVAMAAWVSCMNNNVKLVETLGNNFLAYAPTTTCASCHQDIYDSHLKTAHYLTGQPASKASIKGSFEKGKNAYAYTPAILLSMQQRDSNFYQVAYFKGQEKKAMKFDVVIGSGVMGQSYLNWRGDKLFQLPITYFTEANQWSNSPGFPQDRVLIDRPVTARCLECHVAYAEGKPPNTMEPTAFEKDKIIYGVECQSCHGPGAKHVAYHEDNRNDTIAKFIVNTANLTRQQQIDACALCHSGDIKKTTPSFTFIAGNNLKNHFVIDENKTINNQNLDVHGNQVGLLQQTKCFQLSKSMTCSSCHNTHENQRGNLQMFSQKCISCHNIEDKKFDVAAHRPLENIKADCINCHMPQQTSKSIAVFLQGQEVPKASKLRTHFISIYPKKLL
jgi:hypothetical protein